MKKIFNRNLSDVAIIILFVGIALPTHAQFVTKVYESNNEFYTALAKDPNGNVYGIRSGDGVHSSVVKYAPNSTSFTILFSGLEAAVGGFSETNAGFLPWGLAVNSQGDVYVTTDLSTGNTTTGTNVVNGIALGNHGNVIKLASNNGYNGTVYTASVFLNGGLFYSGLAFDASNNLYVIQTDNTSLSHYTVRRYPPGSTSGTELFNDLNNAFTDNYPHGIVVAPNLDIFVCDAGQRDGILTSGHKGRVKHYVYSSAGGGTYPTQFSFPDNYPMAVALDPSGNLYVNETDGSAYTNYRVNKYNSSTNALITGNIAPLSIGAGIAPDGIAAINSHDIYVLGGGNPSTFFELIGPVTTPASGINFTATTNTTTTINWTNGDGAGRAVFVALANSGTPSPANSTNYTANAAFGSGSQAGAGWYCVFNATTGTSVNVTGLTSGNTYRAMIVEYNGSVALTSENYLTTSNSGNTANVIAQNPTTINSVNRVTGQYTNASSVNFLATFGTTVTGVTAGNFSVTATGVTGVTNANIGTPTTGDGGISWTVPVTTGTGDGTIQLNLANATGLSKTISTSLPFAGQAYTIDKTAPTVTSITRVNATPTNAATVSFLATFSEAITGGTTNNFSVTATGVTGASIASISGTGNTRTVVVNTGTGNGTLRLDMVNSTATTDLAGNSVTGLPYTSGLPYTVYKVTNSADYFRTKNATGNWGTNSDWESSADNSLFITATAIPTNTATAITVQNGHVITVSANQSASNITLAGSINITDQTLSVSGTISGANSSNFVKTDSPGSLKITVGNGVTKLFPVGKSAYDPLSVTNNSGASDDFTVRVRDQVYGAGGIVMGTHVNRTWDIAKTNANAGSGVNLVFNWNTAENGGVITPRMYHFQGGAWVKQTGTTSSTANSLTYTGYTGTFSPFTIGDNVIPLPLSLLSFNATLQDKQVLLNWQTADEQNTDHFVLERSTDAKNYKAIGLVKASGSKASINRYAYTDMLTDDLLYTNKMLYYRLLQLDVNGEFTYSPTVAVTLSSTLTDAPVCFPNPLKNQLYLSSLHYKALTLISSTGVLVYRSAQPVSNIDVSSLLPGAYYLQIELLDGSSVRQKVIKD